METERIQNSKYNIIFSMIQLFLTTVLAFVARSVFINILGKELLGLDGLFCNIISMLSLTELGISTAINFSLYKPIVENDTKKISALMTMYKKLYQKIGISIIVGGLCLMPFLHLFINGHSFDNLYLIFILYLLSAGFSYFFTYRETLINAHQKNYKLFVIKSTSIILLYGLEILFLILTHNFIAYLLTIIIVNFIQNFLVSWYVKKKYPDINYKSKDKIDEDTKKDIIVNVKSLMVTRVGDYLLNGTDNIIISTINIGLTGIYANYLSIIGVMKTIMNTIYNGVVASFGNLAVSESKKTQENVFNISNFACFIISGFITIELVFLFNPFITFWVGKKFLLNEWMVIIIAFNFYFYSQMISLDIIKRATGKYKIDAHISIIQAIVNLAVSIVLGSTIGIGGVILGTLISYLSVALIFKPYLIYKNIFNKSAKEYYITQFKYTLTLLLILLIGYGFINLININTAIINVIVSGLVAAIVYLIIIILLYRKNKSFQYMYNEFIKKHLKIMKQIK